MKKEDITITFEQGINKAFIRIKEQKDDRFIIDAKFEPNFDIKNITQMQSIALNFLASLKGGAE